ncbi:imelysin family protein [Shewanella psychrotolerans]|uniref:imelysin family protein n=1 Tax=Shewanella psychrotolerans TaxID=2864206 RepID=UPI001C65BD7F|nr:imelysin family protein [Shewanella psychrotolerans]QYK02021.1 iron-regulated protein A precursor [Shewanella psychrotolerans]
MKQLKYSAIALALISSLAACGGSGSDDTPVVEPETGFSFSADEMIVNLSDDVIVSGYSILADRGTALLLATQTLVATPTQANLEAAQAAWKDARQPWEQGESHIFGPVDSLGIDPHLDSWPLNTTDLQTVLANSSGFDADTIKVWNDDVQGFHTMEYLLFGDGVNNNVKSIDELSANERDYLMGLAEVFRDYTRILADAWLVSHDGKSGAAYGELLKTPGTNGNTFYSSQVGVIEELIKGMIGIVDEVGNGKIADPFGSSAQTADTSKVESQYSWNSLTDFSDNIIGVRNVYQGEFTGEADKQGIVDFVSAANPELATRVGREIDEAILQIRAIAGTNNMPFRQAIQDTAGRVRVQKAVDALSKLQTSLQNEVLPLLQEWQGK